MHLARAVLLFVLYTSTSTVWPQCYRDFILEQKELSIIIIMKEKDG